MTETHDAHHQFGQLLPGIRLFFELADEAVVERAFAARWSLRLRTAGLVELQMLGTAPPAAQLELSDSHDARLLVELAVMLGRTPSLAQAVRAKTMSVRSALALATTHGGILFRDYEIMLENFHDEAETLFAMSCND